MMLKNATILSERYEILGTLGSGGMGEVYRATDQRLKRDVAIKVLPEHLAANPQALSRFEREAKLLAALSHNNILTIHDFGTDNGISFAVMELLKGQTLREKLASSKLSRDQILEIAVEIAEGLAAAHSAGVIHRDLKPENIFLTSAGGTKILDFGLARREAPASRKDQTSIETLSRTQDGVIAGTVPYMSPEQVRGTELDARTDIFSFGVVLYEMISGVSPFARDTSADTISAILNETPKPLSVSPELNQILQHCMEKNAEKRFQSSHDLVFALRSTSKNIPAQVIYQKPAKRRSLTIGLLVLLVALIGIGTAYYLMRSRGNPIHSLAILPFVNESKNPEAEYLSDGIAESIVASLSRLPQIRIMSHDTVNRYKGKEIDPMKVGRDLNVQAIITGKVLQQGDTLVVRAHLVKVEDGTELWGDQYNRKLNDVLTVQQQISSEISHKLHIQLSGEQEKTVKKRHTTNSEAYQLYLKGRYHWYRFSEEDYKLSIKYYEQAIAKDPNYALAYAGLAETYNAMAAEGLISPKEAFEHARKATFKAVALDNSLGEVYAALSEITWIYDWNIPEAAKMMHRAVELNPNLVSARRYYSQLLLQLGRSQEAISEMKKALELDPLSLETNKSLGARYYWTGKYDEAIALFKKTIELDPNYPIVYDLLADAYAKKKMYDEAITAEQKYLTLLGDEESAATLAADYKTYDYQQARHRQYERVLEMYEQVKEEQYVSPISFATLYSLTGQKDKALDALEKAFQERAPWLTYLHVDPQFESLRSEPRFKSLLQRIGTLSYLPEERGL